MEILSYLKNCFKRLFLYQSLIIFALYKLLLSYRFYKEFIRKLNKFIEDLNIDIDYSDKVEDIFKIYMISLIVLSILSILGIKFFQFITGLFCILNGFIYHNPIQHFKDFNKTFELSFEFLNDFLPSFQFLIFFGLGCAMIKNSFYYNDNNIYDYKISNKQIEMEKMNNKIKKE
jgi:hypothetical protein